MSDHLDFTTALAALEAAARESDPGDLPGIVGGIEKVKAIAYARLGERPAPVTSAPGLLEVPDVAARLAFEEPYVYDLIRRGELRAFHRGKYVRVDPVDLEAFIAAHKAVDNGLGQWQPPRRVRRRVQAAARPPQADAGGARPSARGDNVRRLPVGGGPAEDS